MSSTNPQAMDIDGPSNGPGTLKRCSSAPMINESSTAIMTAANPSSSTREPQSFNNLFGSANQTRTRRFSASFSPVPGSPISARLTPRINQIRQEEHDVLNNLRELAHEKEVHSAMQISQSWEDLRLMTESQPDPKNNRVGPLHVSLPTDPSACSSPSPTRWSCSGFQSPTRSRTFVRRSESPVLRPSPLGVKRKLDEDKIEFHSSPRAKRVYSYSAVERGLLTTTNANSLPGSLSSVGTPESLSSADSPGFGFRNVDSPSPTRAAQPEPMVVAKNDHDMAEGPS